MDWTDLHHVAVLAHAGSLSAAARSLGVEHATVARRVTALETSLGVSLVDRRGRRWKLTSDGERIAAIAERMENDAQAVRRAAGGTRAELAGLVRVSAPPALAVAYLAAPLVAMQKLHPALSIRLTGESRTASLDRGEAELAVRLSRPERGDLTMVKLGQLAFGLYARADYLTKTPEASRRFVGYDGADGRSPQQAALESYAKGRPFSFHASSLEIQQALANAGAGIAALPDFMARADRKLVPVAPRPKLMTRDIWLVVHSDLKGAAPVRAVMRCIQDAFASAGKQSR
ncbi:MAG: LysR family transcriptional regulator [Proteobacteria bacterium]|nr:LysR family transcriptional regulator [Pseudomonadota bacterium]